jgi:hypothetical protein
MKYNKYIAGFLLSVAFISCDRYSDDDFAGIRNVKPVVTATTTSFSTAEGQTITVNLTTDSPNKNKMDFKLVLVGGKGSFRDYTSSGDESTPDDGYGVICNKITFPAFASTASFTLTYDKDLLPEGTENFVYELSNDGNGIGLVADNSKTITVSVLDFTSTDFTLIADWNGTTTNAFGTQTPGSFKDNAGGPHDFSGLDFDMYIFPEDPFTPGQPDFGGTPVGGNASATGAAPEVNTIPAATPDGTYYVVTDYYSGITQPSSVVIPLTLIGGKAGVFTKTIDLKSLYKTDSPVSAPSGGNFIVVASVVKVGTTYTFKNANGATLGSGRTAIPRKK